MIQLLTIGLFIILCLAGIKSPTWALILATTMFAFEQALQASSSLFLSNPALANEITGVICLIMATRLVMRDRTKLNGVISIIYVCTLIIYFWSAISLAWSPARDVASEIILKGIPYLILFIFIAPILIVKIDLLDSFFTIYLYVGTLICILLILNPELTYYNNRISLDLGVGTRTNVLALGGIGGEIIILAALIRIGHPQWLLNITRIVAIPSGAILALQSGSRGQILFSIILSVLFYPVSKKINNLMSFVATIASIIFFIPIIYLITGLFLSEGILSRWDSGNLDEGVGVRILNILELFNVWVQSPISWFLGLGFNAFSSVIPDGSRQGYSHNMTIDILTELGLLIFVVYLIMLYNCFVCSVWLFKKYQYFPKIRMSISIVIVMMLYNLLIANKQNNLWGNQLFFFYSILLFRCRYWTIHNDDLDDNSL